MNKIGSNHRVEKDLAVGHGLSKCALAWIPLQQGSSDESVGSRRSTKNINSQGSDWDTERRL